MIIVRSFIRYTDMNPTLTHTPWLIVEIRDTGVGIPLDQQQHLFTKFYQTTAVDTSRKNPGSGLGLFVVKGIIEAHGGAITCLSELNKGTTFTITLPAIIEHQRHSIPQIHQTLTNAQEQVHKLFEHQAPTDQDPTSHATEPTTAERVVN